jgi:uncharacterized protein YjbI with pentapeptide repeats
LAGALVTFVLIDLILGARQRKEALITRMGSDVRDVTVSAVEDLRGEGWLTDGTLRGVDLMGAHLRGADLGFAQLERADLRFARLPQAVLAEAHLEGANLQDADLERAVLVETHLQRASLKFANLEGAVLVGANLTGASLERATVPFEQLGQAASLAGTIPPDGTELSEDNWHAEFEEWREKQEATD